MAKILREREFRKLHISGIQSRPYKSYHWAEKGLDVQVRRMSGYDDDDHEWRWMREEQTGSDGRPVAILEYGFVTRDWEREHG